MKKIAALGIAIITCLSMAGCNESTSEKEKNTSKKIIGSWKYDSESSDVSTDAKDLTFYEGGGCSNSGESGSWKISGSTISVLGTYGGQFFSHDNLMGEVKIKGDKMIISNPSVDGDVEHGDLVYIKVKD